MNAITLATEFKAYLADCGIAISGGQESKTNTALEFYRARLGSEQSR